MTTSYGTLIITFNDLIKVLDSMFSDAFARETDSLRGRIEEYEGARVIPINGHTVVIASEYNVPYVEEWLVRYTAITEIREF